MHYGHDHHHHDHGSGSGHGSGHGSGAIQVGSRPAFGPGHNHAHGPQRVAQWQRPHLDDTHAHDIGANAHPEADLDLVETAFVEAFANAPDPTSLLRLAQVPFEATAADGAKLALLRVEVDAVTDVGSVMPHLGGESFRYDPLPAALVARRRRLRFVYGDGRAVRGLSYAEVRMLAAI
jgi:hypothetical protein